MSQLTTEKISLLVQVKTKWFFLALIVLLIICGVWVISSINELGRLLVVTTSPTPVMRTTPQSIPVEISPSLEKQQLELLNYNLVRPLAEFTKTIDHWEVYKNERFGFSFEYPNTYLNIPHKFNKDDGTILSIMSFDGEARSLMDTPNPGYFTQITISYWDDINNEYLKGGTWVGEKRYSDFEDLLSDSEHTFITKKGTTTISGIKAYVLSMPGEGAYEAIMFESNGGYYRISFPSDYRPIDPAIKQRFLASFRML